MKLVSVIIPSYNGAKYIKRSVESVLNQTHSNLELFVVDDGSTDNTADVVKQFNDERLTYIRHEKNMGLSQARNTGITRAKGDYIAYLDVDDEWHKDKLEKNINFTKDLGTMYFLFSNAEYYHFDGSMKYDWDQNIKSGEYNYNDYSVTAPSNWFFNKETLEHVGLFDTEFPNFADIDFIVRACRAGVKAYFQADVLAKRYEVEGHLSSFSDKKFRSKQLFLKKHIDFLKDDPSYLYKFYYAIAKDAFNQNKKAISTEYYKKAITVRPFKLKTYYKLFKTIFMRSET